MNGLKNVGLIALGMLLAGGLLWGASATFAQEPEGGWGGWMQRSGGMMGYGQAMMGGEVNHGAMHAAMHNGESIGGMMVEGMDHEAMHAAMHDGEAMPEGCLAMMDQPAGMGLMMERMHGETPMTLDEAREWMSEQGISEETQAQCLAHMAEQHGNTEAPAGETPTE